MHKWIFWFEGFGIIFDFALHFHIVLIADYALFSLPSNMSFKTRFDSVLAFDSSNWLSWSARMSQFLMAQKLWAYVSGLITKPALESTALSTATSCPATAESVKAHNDWVTENSVVIGYIKMKCTESVVVGIPMTHMTSKEVWDGLKEHFDKASATVMLQEICKAFSFRLSGGDPIDEISKLTAIFACLEQCSFRVPDFVQASILIIAIPQKWDTISTWLLSYYSFNKLEYSVVTNVIIREYQCLAGVSWPSQSANKISAVTCKSDHPPSWKGKSREEQPNASGSSDQKKKACSCAGKQVKEQQEATKQRDHAYMAESAMVIDPPTATASSSASLPTPPTPLLVIMTINGNSRIISTPAFILKALLVLGQPLNYLLKA